MKHLLAKANTFLQSAFQLIYGSLAERTGIAIVGKHADARQPSALLIENDSTDMGMLVFGITTRSRHSIEILQIEIDYSPPMQLTDPKKMNFFEASVSDDETLPFRLIAENGFQVRAGLIHVFALVAQFPPGIREMPVRISVRARTLRLLDTGYELVGRTRTTRKSLRVVLSDNPLLGIQIPPGHSLTTIQPFLIQCGLTASSYGASRPTSTSETREEKVPSLLAVGTHGVAE